ncbi:MBL fold metallo-hydrolase [Kribbella sp. NPDC051587]|uniref:MBL fold metallo-hydrolase n=1 Tax=Kribbella sp. NPDC051587 TaxID=3364119 RepID=UPI00379B8B22
MTTELPDYAPVPHSSLGPAMNEQGFYVGRVEKNLYWVTDSGYQAAFLTTPDGVVLFDAPPTLGHNLQRAIDRIASDNGVSNKVTHIVYSHHHADHIGASSLFGRDVVRVGHAETKRLLLRADDPARPTPDLTFDAKHTLEVGGERVNLAWQGSNHTPDNIYIHLPDHETMMLIDVVIPGWASFAGFNVNVDVPGSLAAPDLALAYPWKHFIGGHLGRPGTREDLDLHKQYLADIVENVRTALATVDPMPFYARYGDNAWAAVKGYLDTASAQAAAPVVKKYSGVLGAADVFITSTVFVILESMRLDLGIGLQIHP